MSDTCKDTSVGPVGTAAIYDPQCGKLAGFVSPEEAESYNSNNVPVAEGFVKVFDPVDGKFVGNVPVADASGLITSLTPTIRLKSSVSHVKCNGDSTGSVNVEVIGGTSPYTIVYDGGIDPAALAAGNYKVTVTDSASNSAALSFSIVEPSALGLTTATSADSGSGDGKATAHVTGGTPEYSYEWRDNGGIPIGQTTKTATSLAAGTYQVFVTDANNCTINSTSVVVS